MRWRKVQRENITKSINHIKNDKMEQIKVFKGNDKLNEAFEIMCEKLNAICEQYQLTYFEFFGLLECFKCDLIKQDIWEEEEE